MKSVTVVACAAVLVGCGDNKPAKAQVDAYRSAQTAAQERLRAWQKDFDSAIAEVKDGTWVPRPDLGACVTKLSTPRPGLDEGIDTAFFLENDDWSSLSRRVFDQASLAVGGPDRWLPDRDSIAAETKRVAELLPFDSDVMVLHLDEVVEPKFDGGNVFEPGSEHGRAWVWSSTTHKIICAGAFSGTTPASVTAHIWDQSHESGAVRSSLILAQRRESERSARASLVAAGPPRSP